MHFETNVETGGLMFYGPDFRAMFHRAADLVDKILRGEPEHRDRAWHPHTKGSPWSREGDPVTASEMFE
jgi:hypothetical protein